MKKVSVIIPTYQNARFICRVVESILAQTFHDFEVIVVDDGSTDDTTQILARFADQIRVLHQPNRGPSTARNTGIVNSTGEFIAIMDGDDIAFPERLELQVDYLERNPEVSILGSTSIFVDVNERSLGRQLVVFDDLSIRWTSLLMNPFVHSTVILRRNILSDHNLAYDPNLSFAEDYDLFSRVLVYGRAANLIRPLVKYRVDKNTLTNQVRQDKLNNHVEIALRTIRSLLPAATITPDEVKLLCEMFINGSQCYPTLGVRRIDLVDSYLNLWKAFALRYAGDKGLDTLQRKVALKAARITFFPPILHNWKRIAARLSKLDGGWIWRYGISLPAALVSNLRERGVRRLRK